MQGIAEDNASSRSAIDAARREFFAQLVATREGRQHMLSFSVDAEEGDEGEIFDQLAGVVDDPKLRRMVERHRDDEVRHAGLFRDCLARLGLQKVEVPDEIKIIRQIADGTGGFERGVHGVEDVVATYAMLYVIEERGVEQFPFLAEGVANLNYCAGKGWIRLDAILTAA